MEKDNRTIAREGRDELLGRALSRALAQSGPPGPCLSDEEIAALLDRRVSGSSLERMQAHLACCDRCLATYNMTASLMQSAPESASRGWYRYAAGLAAVAAAVLAVIFTRHTDSPTEQIAQAPTTQNAHSQLPAPPVVPLPEQPAPPPATPLPRPALTPQKPFTALALAGKVYDTAPEQMTEPLRKAERQYGFTAALPPEKAAFRTGVTVIDLAVALKQGNRQQGEAEAERLVQLAGDTAGEQNLKELIELSPAEQRQGYTRLVSRFENHAEAVGQLAPFRLGAWTEAARLANDSALPTLLKRSDLRQLESSLNDQQAGSGVRQALKQLDTRLAEGQPDEKGKKAIRRLLDQLVEMY